MREELPVFEDCAIDFHRRTLRAIESAAALQSARFLQGHLQRVELGKYGVKYWVSGMICD